ncbi:MAG TPA: LpqB family beta-propeller domain-containing protein, partial [Vicinamibacterales bacterium]
MKKLLFASVLAAGTLALTAHAQNDSTVTPRLSFAEPGISPDGSTIAFVSGGDLWEVPAGGGDARLLVSHPATESRPLYSPDGRRLAFTSARTGNGDIYILTLATGEVARLTFDDAPEQASGWSRDGRWVYFSSGSHDLSGMDDVYRVSVDGGTPMPVAGDRYATEYFAAPAPDDRTLAITARGFAGSQWWRNGHSHLDESEIWLVHPSADRTTYEPVTSGGAKDAWPMWSADGRTVFFMSDRTGAQNLWMQPLGGRPRPVTSFKSGRVLWPTISADGKMIAFERDFEIWTVDTATSQARPLSIALRGSAASAAIEHRSFTDQFRDLALSPDGRKVALVVHGDIFATSIKDGGDAIRITATVGDESNIAWSPNSKWLVYVSDRDGVNHLFRYDFTTGRESQLTAGPGRDGLPQFSPNGNWIAFERDSKELRVIDPASMQEKLVATGVFDTPPFGGDRPFVWSPDSRYLAYFTIGAKAFSNVYVASLSGPAEGRAVTFVANSIGGSLSWSPDGTYLTFCTTQRTEPGQVVRVDLVPRTPKFHEDQFRDLFKEETPRPAPEPSRPVTAEVTNQDQSVTPEAVVKKPVEIVFDDIRDRVSAVAIGLDVSQQTISPDGKWLLLTASAAGQENLYVYPLDEFSKEPAVARQLTSTAGPKGRAQFTSDSKEVVYLDRGRLFTLSLEKREPRQVAVTAELDIDFSREKQEVFRQTWTYLRDLFFDSKMNG